MLSAKMTISVMLWGAICAPVFAAECPADAPEGYAWLSGYVDEFRESATINSWFAQSLTEHPDDYALIALQAYFDADGNYAAGQSLAVQRGLSAERYAQGLACADVLN